LYRSFSGGISWQRLALVDNNAVMGTMETTPQSATPAVWDEGNTIRVRLFQGELISRTHADVLNGANLAAIQHSEGWEIIQFRNAELLASNGNSNTYLLSGFLRGSAGTEQEMRSSFPTNPTFVLLSDAIPQTANIAPRELHLQHYWRAGPAHVPYSDITYQAFQYTHQGINQRPLSPVHLRAHRRGNRDVILNWIRRTRDLSQDGWGATDVPLGEREEKYEIEIIYQSNVVAIYTVYEPRFIYTRVEQSKVFTPRNPFTIKIYQISATFGRGAPHQEDINV